VSEEEFRNMQIILRHYIPDTDLTPDNLRTLALGFQTTKSSAHEREELNALSPPMTAIFNETGETDLPSVLIESLNVPYSIEEEAEDNILQRVLSLYHKLGCLLEDSQGQYRKSLAIFLEWALLTYAQAIWGLSQGYLSTRLFVASKETVFKHH
jgi:hypothetical protein